MDESLEKLNPKFGVDNGYSVDDGTPQSPPIEHNSPAPPGAMDIPALCVSSLASRTVFVDSSVPLHRGVFNFLPEGIEPVEGAAQEPKSTYGLMGHVKPLDRDRWCRMEEELSIEEEELRLRRKRLDLERLKLPGPSTSNGGLPNDDSGCSAKGHKPADSSSLDAVLGRLALGLSLPKIEIEPFHGTPTEFVSFMTTFATQLEPHLTGQRQKLSYLIYYCRGPAKDAIKHCVLLPEESCFSTAVDILRSRYGRPHQVIRAVTQDLFDGPSIPSSDAKALEDLLQQMRDCSITLSQLSRTADLNCTSNLMKIVRRLPKPLQIKWAEIAESMLAVGKEASFEDLLALVERRVAVASTEYGELAFRPATPHRAQTSTRRVASVSVDNQAPRCPICSNTHAPKDCKTFLEYSIERRWQKAKEKNLCFRCLKGSHRIRDCKSRIVCLKEGCTKHHHPLLHSVKSAEPKPNGDARVCTSYGLQHDDIQLGFVPVRLRGPDGEVATYAFLDNGSDCTLLDKVLARRLGLITTPSSLQAATLHGVRTIQCERTRVEINSLDGTFSTEVDPVIVVNSMPVRRANVYDTEPRLLHLQDIPLPKLSDRRVGLLIGCDVPEAHWVAEQRVGSANQPFASKSPLGWIIRGPVGSGKSSACHVNAISTDSESTDTLVARLYNNEFGDTDDPEIACNSVEDEVALSLAERSVRLIDGHYEVAVPWKTPCKDLHDNKSIAQHRLYQLKRRLIRDERLRSKYIETMNSHEAKHYVSRASCELKRWYLPHHPVVNPKKPEKLRVVFDCAAQYRGTSLNDALLQGPDWTNSLTGVLLRFRNKRVALSADIKEMFLQVRLPEQDRWAFSFLWWPGGDLSANPSVYQWNVHPFGAKSSPFCANFALRRVVADNNLDYRSVTLEAVRHNFYVDDLLVSVDSVEDAAMLTQELRSLLQRGGFQLLKWISNYTAALDDIPLEERGSTPLALSLEGTFHRTLGVNWHVESDIFKFEIRQPKRPHTRRSVLAYLASIYDPLGFVAPALLPGKIILQDICRDGLGWDAALPAQYNSRWEKWIDELRHLEDLEIPRCTQPVGIAITASELHVFSDASERGYGAVAYIRQVCPDGSGRCYLLMGKSRVAPLKFVTIPRLELTAALLAAKLSAQLVRESGVIFRRVTLWTDSSIVLSYLTNTVARYATFVANRVRRIRELTSLNQWRFVSTSINPADLASRGIPTCGHLNLSSWLRGPEFLQEPDSNWPSTEPPVSVPLDELEIKRTITAIIVQEEHSWIENLSRRVNSWPRLLRMVAWLTRFKRLIVLKTKGRPDLPLMLGPIKVSEMATATDDIIRMVQRRYLAIRTKEPNGEALQVCPALRPLRPFMENGIVYLGGRVAATRLPILPANCRVTDLVVQHFHTLEGHSGATHILAAVRDRFWLIKGMATVRRNLRRCVQCRRLWAKPCQQAMGPLPSCRIDDVTYPFHHCGVDYFGPFIVKHGRSESKRYGCLFTCMQIRAIHVEVAHDMSTDSFLSALVRFIARRGAPKHMYSDNGSNLVGADRELRLALDTLDQNRIIRRLSERNIEWHFNPPYASHRGGAWERIIRTIRRLLTNVMRQQVVTDEVLLTSMAEVERIVNNRPLVPAFDDPEHPNALRPSDLLLVRSNENSVQVEIPLRERYTRNWRRAQHLANTFWKQWRREYLPTLQVTRKWLTPQRNIRKGDLVLLSKVDSPRGEWPMGVVNETYPGPDGLVRQALIRTSSGVVRRDVRSLCLLEGAED